VFGKLVLLILVLGGVSAAMLVDRQQRLDLAAEMKRSHARLRQHEQAIWRLRADLAYRARPHEIRAALERLDVRMVPIPDRLARPREEVLLPSLAVGDGSGRSAPAGRKPVSEPRPAEVGDAGESGEERYGG
jgi:hypothetical protein